MIATMIVGLASCKKEAFNGLSDVRPAVPVTVRNAVDYRPEPTVQTSIAAGGAIQIILEIPASSGRTIKEISRIALSTTYSKIQGTTGLWNMTGTTINPIAVNATSYTFNTTLAEYTAKGGGAIPGAGLTTGAGVSTTAGTETSQRFYFMLTLDNGDVLISESVRVLVTN